MKPMKTSTILVVSIASLLHAAVLGTTGAQEPLKPAADPAGITGLPAPAPAPKQVYKTSEPKAQPAGNTNLAKGRVLAVNPNWDFCVVSLGDKQGGTINQVLIVARDGQAIGKVKITQVEAAQSIADIVPGTFAKNTFVQPGDDVVFTGEDIPPARHPLGGDLRGTLLALDAKFTKGGQEPKATTGQDIIRDAKLQVLRENYEETLSEAVRLEKAALSVEPEERAKMERKARALRDFLQKLEMESQPLAKPTTGSTSSAPTIPAKPEPKALEAADAQRAAGNRLDSRPESARGPLSEALEDFTRKGLSGEMRLAPEVLKAMAELDKVKNLAKSGQATPTDVTRAEQRLKWTVASDAGDRVMATFAKIESLRLQSADERAAEEGKLRRLELVRALVSAGVADRVDIPEIRKEMDIVRAADAKFREKERAAGTSSETPGAAPAPAQLKKNPEQPGR